MNQERNKGCNLFFKNYNENNFDSWFFFYFCNPCPGGEIGRRTTLRGWRVTVLVRIQSWALNSVRVWNFYLTIFRLGLQTRTSDSDSELGLQTRTSNSDFKLQLRTRTPNSDFKLRLRTRTSDSDFRLCSLTLLLKLSLRLTLNNPSIS